MKLEREVIECEHKSDEKLPSQLPRNPYLIYFYSSVNALLMINELILIFLYFARS